MKKAYTAIVWIAVLLFSDDNNLPFLNQTHDTIEKNRQGSVI